jgi:4-amino-4-deoxy-L-arabinose transferase-like glycosyltransferase
MNFLQSLCRVWQAALKPGAVRWLFPGSLAWLACLAWIRPLHIPDEGRYVGVTLDMIRFDSVWTPLLNGLPYFHKPPLFYWLNELSFALFGISEWAARAPSIFVSWLTIMATYLFVRRHRGVEVATLTFVALLTMPYYYGASQYANHDMLVAAMIILTILSAAEAVSRQKEAEPYVLFAVAAGAFAALAVLSKGLIGVVLPGGVMFFWLLATRRWSGFKVLLGPWVWVAFFVVVTPWFIAMEYTYRGFLHYFFVYQHFERYLSAGFNQQQPVWFFIPVIFGMTLPWSFWLIRYGWRRGDIKWDSSWFWLMGLWIVVITVFFSIPASKLIGYTVPVIVPLAILIAEAVAATWRGIYAKRDVQLTAVTLGLGWVACVVALTVFTLPGANGRSSEPGVKALAEQMTPNDQFVLLDIYPFDLAFYTRNPHPTWVILHWPSLQKADTWRNELGDAGEFDPIRAKEALLTPDQVLPRMCTDPERTYWFFGYPHELPNWSFLQNRPTAYERVDFIHIWKVRTDTSFKSQWCP